MTNIELPTSKLNRAKKKEPKSGSYWCPRCDCTKICIGEKCKNCGYQDKSFFKHTEVS